MFLYLELQCFCDVSLPHSSANLCKGEASPSRRPAIKKVWTEGLQRPCKQAKEGECKSSLTCNGFFFIFLDVVVLFLLSLAMFSSTFLPLAANWSLTDQCFQHEKGVSLESRYEGTKIFTPCPQKIGFGAQKRPNLAQNWHFV